jgi:hypothetical protein
VADFNGSSKPLAWKPRSRSGEPRVASGAHRNLRAFLSNKPKSRYKAPAILIVAVDRLAFIATRRHVVDGASGFFDRI